MSFPSRKISIRAAAGNLPDMRWTADAYVCISGGSGKGENPLKDAELGGCNYGEQKSSPRKMKKKKKERKKSIKSKNVQHKKKDENPLWVLYDCDESLQVSPS